MKDRIKRIYDNIKEKVDVILIKNGTDPYLDMTFFYVTNLKVGLFEGATALLWPDKELEILVSLLEEESAKKCRCSLEVYKTKKEWKKLLQTKLSKAKKIGINSKELTHRSFLEFKKLLPKSRFIDVSEAIQNTRLIKDDEEIKTLRVACKIASEVAEDIVDFIHKDMKEYELAAEISYQMQKRGASGPSFETISAFGKNSAEPHYTYGDARLKKGDFILLDFGARYQKYCSDITRTFFLGKASEKQKNIYENVLHAQQVALKKIRAGVKGADVHSAIERLINRTEYKGRFTHGLGHSIGLSTHDGASLAPSNKLRLKENMVFTVEPGIYIPGYGGVRIEDNIIVTKKDVELLTTAKKDLIEI